MENININLATLERTEEILSILNSSCENLISKENLENDLKNERCLYYIAYFKNLPIAYIGTSYICEDMDIIDIVVTPKYRKKGIATLLMNKVIYFCKENNIKRILLEVRQNNAPALSLYNKFNFTKISTRKNYYKDQDAYIYELKL